MSDLYSAKSIRSTAEDVRSSGTKGQMKETYSHLQNKMQLIDSFVKTVHRIQEIRHSLSGIKFHPNCF